MITPILEKLLLTGEATYRRITLMGSTQFVLPATDNKTNIITKITTHPFLSLPATLPGGFVTDLEVLQMIYGPNVKSLFITEEVMQSVVERCAVQLQFRNKYSRAFFTIKPEVDFGFSAIVQDPSAPVTDWATNTRLKYSRQDIDTFFMYDSDQYLDLTVLGETTAAMAAASAAFKPSLPDGSGITTLAQNADPLSGTLSIVKNTGFGIYSPAAEQYINVSFASSAETEFQAYGHTPYVLMTLEIGNSTVLYGTKIFMPWIDLDIITLNDISALKKIKS